MAHCGRWPLPDEFDVLPDRAKFDTGARRGFLGRKGDDEPGTKALWTGLQRVMDFAAGIRAYRSGDESCV
ncbi:MAG: family transposase [Burkholderia sp.]|nr:family transposase [Burkholderia sp.]